MSKRAVHRLVRIYLKVASVIALAAVAAGLSTLPVLGTRNLPTLVGNRPAANTTVLETAFWVGLMLAFVASTLFCVPKRRVR